MSSEKNIALKEIKDKIEKMSKYHQTEILRILKQYNDVTINENKNGSFINLTEVPEQLVEHLLKYSEYVEEQQRELKEIETEKERIENKFFSTHKN
jgi:CTP-dependent riboflavin kinase